MTGAVSLSIFTKGTGMTTSDSGSGEAPKRTTRKGAARSGSKATKEDPEVALLATIAEMADADRILAERLHAIVKTHAPILSPKLWYGMPAYANKEGKPVCFFQSAGKFKTRYATLGFMHEANLDEGSMWPTAFALKGLNDDEERRIVALLKKALS